MILGLQELKFIFNPVTGLRYGEFEARLAGLMWGLKEGCEKNKKKNKNKKTKITNQSSQGRKLYSSFSPLRPMLLKEAEQFSHY